MARGEAEIGLGTDTGGSIRIPDSYNGLWGLRPTHGVISSDGLVPLAPCFDTVGWLCRDHDTLVEVVSPLLSLTGRRLETYREHLMGMTALAGLWGAPHLFMPLLHDDRDGGGHAPWGLSLLGAPGQDQHLVTRARTYRA